MAQVYALMQTQSFTSVAVLDKNGLLLDTISAADWQEPSFAMSTVNMLYSSVEKYLKSRKSKHKPYMVSPDTTFYKVINDFVKSTQPYLFVVDKDQRPITVLSHLDIIRALISN